MVEVLDIRKSAQFIFRGHLLCVEHRMEAKVQMDLRYQGHFKKVPSNCIAKNAIPSNYY